MNSNAKSALVAYVASPHGGYLKLFRKYEGAKLYILGERYTREFVSLTRNLPANTAEESRAMIQALGLFEEVLILDENVPSELEERDIVMPDEDVSRAFAEKYLLGRNVVLDSTWRLRWDWNAVEKPNLAPEDATVTAAALHRELLGEANDIASKSPDWWRQVGAVLARDGKPVLAAFNAHYPSEQSAYLEGDPRSNFGPGERIDVTGALHAEVGVLTEAARRGIRTEGCDLYVTTFPCPPCAFACANAGIARLFYADGYSLLAGADALRSRNVEILKVDMTTPSP